MDAFILTAIYCVITYVISGVIIFFAIKKAKTTLSSDNPVVNAIIVSVSERIKKGLIKPSVIVPIGFMALFVVPVVLPPYLIGISARKISKAVKKSKQLAKK